MEEEINPSTIDREATERVAKLSRLALNEEELERFSHHLGSILKHAEEMSALDLEGVAPTSHPYPLKNVLREDEVSEDLSDKEEVLNSAPSQEDGQFQVPPILGEA